MNAYVEAECMIRQLHARYGDAVWRQDYDAFADCFAEDAEWRIGGKVMEGRDTIVGHIRKMLPQAERILMTFRTPILELHPDGSATSRTYVTENNVFYNERPGSSIGIYYERFEKFPDRWRFKWRLFQIQYIGPADIKGPMYKNPDFGPPPLMPPADAPTYDHTGLNAQAYEAP